MRIAALLTALVIASGALRAQDARPLPDFQALYNAVRRNLTEAEKVAYLYAFKERRTDIHTNPFGRIGTGGTRVFEVYPSPTRQLTYRRLAQTASWIAQGLPYVATHPDRVCPTDRAIVLPDCGSICALFESATGRRPDAVPGKPNPAMLESIFAEHGLLPHEVAVIGDRLYTDIRMARNAGALAVLTLTGETQQTDVDAAAEAARPDIVVRDLDEFARLIEKARDAR